MEPLPTSSEIEALLRSALADPDTTWSLGSFGALAEFVRDANEPSRALPDERIGLATDRGALALTLAPGLRPVAYETGFSGGYNHAVALCLPEADCAMAGRTQVTELGPDRDAAREEDRAAILFDLGLGLRAVDACVRVSDREILACLRAGTGRPLFAGDNPVGLNLAAMSPHRVFRARLGRIEVYTPIPRAGQARPAGPRTLVLPAILRAGRTHAATTPIPAGFVPCASLDPPHPGKDRMGRRTAFDPARHAAFQALLDRWGDPGLLAVKRGSVGMLPEGVSPRHARSARRAAACQAHLLHEAGLSPIRAHEAVPTRALRRSVASDAQRETGTATAPGRA
ncbi:hypothetical protein [Methylobacterium sp. B4]|uniref:DUF6925 family protein n=1 Tax=Methylobacterium sp. B4 TaxID=1938755 RepID=UPI000D946EFF|nr:hypothetical protein [Methylobacterium sp. B4]PXW66817.1 hypothetical protein BY998_101377 [Methylobacterium sp. B4]